ncbi:heavy metal translocating P-type ATPase [Gaetbulibacter saemankumensis]|uniref:heavy metal translocating P-type ATPase n=1 Tax=Gaetbulibacter saemankumensis TaxID=311208 RepID=UPI0004159AB6|nr:heavy metal translocating P-type ATPase [Gaetbulibacter saemankumensis]
MNKLQIEINELKNPRKARRIEQILSKRNGINEVAISTSGIVYLRWNPHDTSVAEILSSIQKLGFHIKDVTHDKDNSHRVDHHEHQLSILNLFGTNTELYFAITSGVFWFTGVVCYLLPDIFGTFSVIFYIISAVFGGVFTFITAGNDLFKGKFEIDFLMLFAAIGAGALGKWGEGALLLFLFSLGHALEHYAMQKARKSIAALADLVPPVALLKSEGELVEVSIEALNIGDIIVVKPNSKIAADGVVIKGSSPVNQASITGESLPVDKRPSLDWEQVNEIKNLSAEHRVFAGTLNGNGILEIKVLKQAKDSTLSRLITLVKEAETQKSPTQHLADKFEKYYVPLVLILVLLMMFAFLIVDETFQVSFYRALSVLIAASPCALAISTPSAVLAGIARAARQGVLIKGGRPLEDLGGIKAIAFDKTGTLTKGKPMLTNVIPFGNTTRSDLLKVAVAVEALSDHPLAAAIVEGAKEELKMDVFTKAENLKALMARGIQASLGNSIVHIGNRRLFVELTGKKVPEAIDLEMAELESTGHTAMIVHRDDIYMGIVSVMDIARPEAAATLTTLKNMNIERMVMLTGDNQKVADAIAKNIGITDPLGSLLPEEKVSAIKRLKLELGMVAMVGDGVNDAPAMAISTVGIAMGAAGSDVALETADIALMADTLDNLPFAIGLSRKAKRIIKQNLVISLGMVGFLVPLTIMGIIDIGPAVVGHEGSTVLVVLNALRLLRFDT